MIRRTTVAAEADVLETLKREAARRGLSMAVLAGEILAEKVTELRLTRRPRIALGRSGSGTSQAIVDREDLPAAQ